MKNFGILISVFALISCNKVNNTDQSISSNYELEITDSIRVDYLEELILFDIDDGRFLAKKDLVSYIIFDETGKITSHIELKTDGPNAINMVYSTGFFGGRFTIMDLNKGLIQFTNEGEIINNISIPEDYIYMHPYNRPAFELGSKLAYYRPERDLIYWDDQEKFYKEYYKTPLLEVFDPITKEVELKMEIPETSIYQDGDFHFLYHPQIVKRGKIWYLFLMAELKFYVYEEKDEDLIFRESVSLNIKDQVPFPQSDLQNTYELFSKLEKVISSMIEQLYAFDDKIILIYRKGVNENIVQNYNRENQSEWREFLESLPKYAAVFDSEYKLLQDDIELPKGIISTPVANKDGEIFVQKNQSYFGEEDWNTYYKLKLTEKKQ